MAITHTNLGYRADFRIDGKRIRKTFQTKKAAQDFELLQRSQRFELKQKKSKHRLSDFVDIWHCCHGVNLRAGADTFARLKALCAALKNPLVCDFKAEDFARYRIRRIDAGLNPATANKEYSFLRAVFSVMIQLGHFEGVNPMARIRPLKVCERELSFLSRAEIDILLNALRPDAALISKVCLSTGARWSEAEGLRVSQVCNGQIQFTGTKSGKNRSIPVCDSLITELATHGADDSGRFFRGCSKAFKCGLDRSGLKLPRGQLTHILRHTFASHFVMRGGNVTVLQKILGHSSLTMTMRYAHLSPDHLSEARAFNPLV